MKRTFIFQSEILGNKKAFEIISDFIKKKPNALISLAVGKTTDEFHKLISLDVKKYPNKWKNIKIIQLDENLGVSKKSKKSFYYELKSELKDLFKILNKKNVFLMDGKKDPKQIIKEANLFIKENQGIDLITLGIGPEYDPHIAYNTTGKSSLSSGIRVVKLHPKVGKNISKYGITLGIKEILSAKKIVLLAYGKNKSKSIHLAFKNKKVHLKKASASALNLHKNIDIILDKDAAS